MSALTKALVGLYLVFAGTTALMLLWLLLRALSEKFASGKLVVPPPPPPLLVAAILSMMAARIAAAWAYRRDGRASPGMP
jgi:hypothetical protein